MKFLFDLGGVFFDWSPKYFYQNIFSSNVDMDFFLSNICNQEWNNKQDQGRSIQKAVNELVNKHPDFSDQIAMYYKNHRKMIKGLFQPSIDILLHLKKYNFECYVLSNWSSETFKGMVEEYAFLKKFDGIIISGNEKLVKPDYKIFELAISRFNLIPKETVFIDDKKENIESAKKLNFHTIHLIEPKNIRKEVYKFI